MGNTDSSDKYGLRDTYGLKPHLNLITTIAIVTGAMIGSGIFKKPAVMASQLGDPALLLGIWVLAGGITLIGALTNAEIAGMITKTGGQYVYFQKMYGNLVAYLYGWAIFAVIQTGSIASITYVFAEYSEYFYVLPRFPEHIEKGVELYIPYIGSIFPLNNFGVKSLTMFIIIFLTTVNYYGVKFGGRVSLTFTSLKIMAILLLIGFGFAYSGGSAAHFSREYTASLAVETGIFSAVIAAMAGAFWSFDGWNNITYLAGEVKRPQINIPGALIIGTGIVIGVYLLFNVAIIYIMPIEEAAGSYLVAADAANAAMGPIGAAFVAALVMISTFGTSNGTIMASARVYFAMSRDKMFFNSIGYLHPRFRTPSNALVLQAVWACFLVMSGTFDILTDMLIFVSWIFYAIGAYGVFVLRKKMPDAPRPYKVTGYPWLPAIFIIFAFGYVIFTLYNDINNYMHGRAQIIDSLFGLLLLFAGVPLYLWFKSKGRIKE
ncbi:MAG: APC family permease [Candidatus Kapaibacterium sp.]